MGAKPGTKHEKFPKDYRDETADYVIAAGRPVREVARELGLAESALGDWARRMRAEPSGAPAQARPAPDEPRAARRRVEELERENAFPERAAALVARGCPWARGARRWRRRGPSSPSR